MLSHPDQMREIFKLLGKPGDDDLARGIRPLTRLHVHTLAYQAILVRKGSAWKNTRIAAAKASLTANRHVCASNWVRWQETNAMTVVQCIFYVKIFRST